jgi:sugar phosphate isomerase/epimerase
MSSETVAIPELVRRHISLLEHFHANDPNKQGPGFGELDFRPIFAALGEVDKARWLAARIREFRTPGSDEFLAPCARPAEAAQAFQCQPPRRTYHWREFTRD